jgi:hypothetical protein
MNKLFLYCFNITIELDMKQDNKTGFIYILTDQDKIAVNKIKVGFTQHNKTELLSQYYRALPEVYLLAFYGLENGIDGETPIPYASDLEISVKSEYSNNRIKNGNGNKSEWLFNVDYKLVMGFIQNGKNYNNSKYIEKVQIEPTNICEINSSDNNQMAATMIPNTKSLQDDTNSHLFQFFVHYLETFEIYYSYNIEELKYYKYQKTNEQEFLYDKPQSFNKIWAHYLTFSSHNRIFKKKNDLKTEIQSRITYKNPIKYRNITITITATKFILIFNKIEISFKEFVYEKYNINFGNDELAHKLEILLDFDSNYDGGIIKNYDKLADIFGMKNVLIIFKKIWFNY